VVAAVVVACVAIVVVAAFPAAGSEEGVPIVDQNAAEVQAKIIALVVEPAVVLVALGSEQGLLAVPWMQLACKFQYLPAMHILLHVVA